MKQQVKASEIYPRQTLAIISSKLSWKQDLSPNSYCTEVIISEVLTHTTIVPQNNASMFQISKIILPKSKRNM